MCIEQLKNPIKKCDDKRWVYFITKKLLLLMDFALHFVCNQLILRMEDYTYIPQAPKTQHDQTECIIIPFKLTSPVHYTLPGGPVIHSVTQET